MKLKTTSRPPTHASIYARKQHWFNSCWCCRTMKIHGVNDLIVMEQFSAKYHQLNNFLSKKGDLPIAKSFLKLLNVQQTVTLRSEIWHWCTSGVAVQADAHISWPMKSSGSHANLCVMTKNFFFFTPVTFLIFSEFFLCPFSKIAHTWVQLICVCIFMVIRFNCVYQNLPGKICLTRIFNSSVKLQNWSMVSISFAWSQARVKYDPGVKRNRK